MPAPAKKIEESDQDDEITVERRVKMPAAAAAYASTLTTRMPKVDSRLLAIARGELDPEDPFGGLIPIYESDGLQEVDEAWLLADSERVFGRDQEQREGMFGHVVPRLRLLRPQVLALTMSDPCRLFVSQIDGKRTVGQLIDTFRMDDLEGLEVIDELLHIGAIELS